MQPRYAVAAVLAAFALFMWSTSSPGGSLKPAASLDSELATLRRDVAALRAAVEGHSGGAGTPAAAAPQPASSVEAGRAMLATMHARMSEIARAGGNGMGNTGNDVRQPVALFDMVRLNKPKPNVICEIGFNVGHSAAVWMAATTGVSGHTVRAFHVFDTVDGPTVTQGFEYIKTTFPATAFTLTKGNSKDTVPAFLAAHPDVKCDLLHIGE
jgi:hypothetical protein